MNDETHFAEVLSCMGYETHDADVMARFRAFYSATKEYLLHSGMKETNLHTKEAVAAIAIGINDLLNGEPGKETFSPAFKMLAMHLASRG